MGDDIPDDDLVHDSSESAINRGYSIAPTLHLRTHPATDSRILPFDPSILTYKAKEGVEIPNVNSCTTFQFNERDQLYGILLGFIGNRLPPSERVSFTACPDTVRSGAFGSKTVNPELIALSLGTGFFSFVYNGDVLYAIHQEVGDPVGTEFEAKSRYSLVLLAPGRNQENLLRHLCAEAYQATLKETHGTILVFRWAVHHEFWQLESEVTARPIDSVILDPGKKNAIVQDMEEFLTRGARDFYRQHGIPYKRAYLLHGIPGSGKTSLIQALAGHFQRSISFIHPSHPGITDDGLRAAFQRLPARSIIVLEDIDSLFDKDRKKELKDSKLSFSGLLNAIDGIGGAEGQLIFMTTNYKNRLDPALIRRGRVDMHMEFNHASLWQMEEYFRQFYPNAPASLAKTFASRLKDDLNDLGREVSTASLQHFFVVHRTLSAQEALDSSRDILEDLRNGNFEDTEDNNERKCKERENIGASKSFLDMLFSKL